MFNKRYQGFGLHIQTPQTIVNVKQQQVPRYVERFDGLAVVKVRIPNAGQGIFTITNSRDLADFMALNLPTSDSLSKN